MNITRADKKTVVEIIALSMYALPGIKWVIGNKPHTHARRMNALADFVFETAFERKGIYLSSDKTGVAVFFRKDSKKYYFKDIWYQFKFALFCTGLKRALEVHRTEAYVSKQRPGGGHYLYFWVFSVHPSARRFGAAASELKDKILAESKLQQLPIYLETSNLQNKRVYERYGFKVYHEWFIPGRNFTLWFMKRESDASEIAG